MEKTYHAGSRACARRQYRYTQCHAHKCIRTRYAHSYAHTHSTPQDAYNHITINVLVALGKAGLAEIGLHKHRPVAPSSSKSSPKTVDGTRFLFECRAPRNGAVAVL